MHQSVHYAQLTLREGTLRELEEFCESLTTGFFALICKKMVMHQCLQTAPHQAKPMSIRILVGDDLLIKMCS